MALCGPVNAIWPRRHKTTRTGDDTGAYARIAPFAGSRDPFSGGLRPPVMVRRLPARTLGVSRYSALRLPPEAAFFAAGGGCSIAR